MAELVYLSSIYSVDSLFNGMAYRLLRLLVVLWSPTKLPPASSDCPRSKPDCRNFKSARTERTFVDLHDSPNGLPSFGGLPRAVNWLLSTDQHGLSHLLHLKDRFLSAHEESFQSMLYANAITQGQRAERCANEFLLARFRAEDVRISNGAALRVTVRTASRTQS